MVTTRVKKERVSYSTSTSAASYSTSTAPKKEKKPAKKAPKSATKATAKKKTKKDFGGAGKDMRSKRQKEKQKKLLDEIAASQNLGKLGKDLYRSALLPTFLHFSSSTIYYQLYYAFPLIIICNP